MENQGGQTPVSANATFIGGQPVTSTVKYAGFWVRAAATFIDGIVIYFIQFVVGFLIGFLLGVSGFGTDFPPLTKFFLNLAGVLCSWAYVIVMVAEYQATLGKMAVGLKIQRVSGEGVGYGRAFLREIIGKLLSCITLFVGYLMVAWTAKKQGLHDKIADTVVVEVNPSKKKTIWVVLAVLFTFALPVLGIVASIGLASLNVARVKGQEALVNSIIRSALPQALLYYDGNKNSYLGFVPKIDVAIPTCSAMPIVNVSGDGQKIAVFMKSCQSAKEVEYYCADDDEAVTPFYKEIQSASEQYALSGATSCQ